MLKIQPRINLSQGCVAVVVTFLLSWKLLRLTGVNQLHNLSLTLWNLHAFFSLTLLCVVTYFLVFYKKFKNINIHDFLIFLLMALACLSSAFNGFSTSIIINLAIPASTYFIGKWFFKDNFNYLIKILDSIFGLLLIIGLLDLFFANFNINSLIDYNFIKKAGTHFNIHFNNLFFPHFHVFLKTKMVRSIGVTMVLHASAILNTAILLYFLARLIYARNNKSNISFYVFCLIISALLIFLSSVGTSIIVLLICIPILFRSKSLYLLVGASFFPILFFVWKSSSNIPLLEMLPSNPYKAINNFYELIKLILLGDSNIQNPIFGSSEVFLVTYLFSAGIVSSILFLYLICKYFVQYFLNPKLNKPELMPFAILNISLIFGCIHYNSFLIFPNSLLFFLSLGILSTQSKGNSYEK